MRILLYLIAFLIPFSTFSQCVPTLSGPDFTAVPDTIENLPTAYFPGSYEATIQMYVPTDTFVDALNLVLPLDSLFITGIDGLPITFEYEVYPSAGPIPGGTPICIQFSNPIVYEEVEGVHPLFIHVLAWSVGLPANGDITGYVLTVEPLPVGVEERGGELILSNVVSDHLHLTSTQRSQNVEIVNFYGQRLYSEALGSDAKIDVQFLPSGMYLLRTALGTAKFMKVAN